MYLRVLLPDSAHMCMLSNEVPSSPIQMDRWYTHPKLSVPYLSFAGPPYVSVYTKVIPSTVALIAFL